MFHLCLFFFKHNHFGTVKVVCLLLRVVTEPLGTCNSLLPVSVWHADGPELILTTFHHIPGTWKEKYVELLRNYFLELFLS